jgi:hypothetical protein
MNDSSQQGDAVLHVAYLPGSAGWLLPVIGRLRATQNSVLKRRAEAWGESHLAERGLVLSTKLAMLAPVHSYLNWLLKRLHQEIAALDTLDEHLERGAGFVPADRELPYAILAALDSVVFEYRSTYEILGSFLRQFGKQILDRDYSEAKTKEVLASAGLDLAWSDRLAALRKRLFHEAAAWIAVDLQSRSPLQWELLILDSKAHAAHSLGPGVPFAEIQDIQTGMAKALDRLHEWLFEEIGDFEDSAAA